MSELMGGGGVSMYEVYALLALYKHYIAKA